MKVELLVARGEAFHQELGREYYLTGAGLKDDPAFQAVYERYADLYGDAAVAAAQASGSQALLEWVVDVRLGRAVASLEEQQLVWEQQAVVEVDGRRVPYLRAPIELANTPDPGFRHALDRARSALGAGALNALRRDRFSLEREGVAALGLGGYVDAMTSLTGIDLRALGESARGFLSATADLYVEHLARVAKRRLGIGVDALQRADAPWLFRADRYDAAFPPDRLVQVAQRQMGEMGLDATQGGRVRIDTEERPAKQPRAFCAPVRVPDEVYLVLRPRGGHQDYRAFWHELGHAMHFAAVPAELPFAARWLGDNSVTEGYAMLWDHLTLDPAWLQRYAELSRAEAASLLGELAVGELFIVRRYAAKLCYELELHERNLAAMGPTYAEYLTAATRFRYPETDYLIDVDPGFYAARYLRAWQLEALLADCLEERFDTDWYRNPRAGGFVHDLMRRGQADPADVVAGAAAGEPLAFERVAQRAARLLGAS